MRLGVAFVSTGRLHVRDDAQWVAELLMDLEDDAGEIGRLRLIAELRQKVAKQLHPCGFAQQA